MIIVRLLGGLGNQMFQYAAGLALAEARRTVLKLDVSWFQEYPEHAAHNRYALSCFNITEQFATEEEIIRCRGVQLTRSERLAAALAKKLRLYQLAQLYPTNGHWYIETPHITQDDFLNLPNNTYLDGMFQSERFFLPSTNLLRKHFSLRYPPTFEVQAVAARITSAPSIALHFRRGDYISNPSFSRELGSLNLAYYHQALAHLSEKSPSAKVYIFSDDIEAVASELKLEVPHEFVRCVEPWHPWDKIRLMSLCEHIAIANSTFSWWAAWLNPSAEKLVIAPEPWFAGSKHNGADIVPTSWIRLPRAP